MASMEVEQRKYTHKNQSNVRGTLSRTRATVNGKKIDLRKLAARRTLKVRKNERLLTNGN